VNTLKTAILIGLASAVVTWGIAYSCIHEPRSRRTVDGWDIIIACPGYDDADVRSLFGQPVRIVLHSRRRCLFCAVVYEAMYSHVDNPSANQARHRTRLGAFRLTRFEVREFIPRSTRAVGRVGALVRWAEQRA
jgi:hypothetical protein